MKIEWFSLKFEAMVTYGKSEYKILGSSLSFVVEVSNNDEANSWPFYTNELRSLIIAITKNSNIYFERSCNIRLVSNLKPKQTV